MTLLEPVTLRAKAKCVDHYAPEEAVVCEQKVVVRSSNRVKEFKLNFKWLFQLAAIRLLH